ncbi:hypothetical protein SALBM311S_08494 [Streptomyces alboniger]
MSTRCSASNAAVTCGLHPNHVPTTLQIYEDRHGREEEGEVRELGSFRVSQSESHVSAPYWPSFRSTSATVDRYVRSACSPAA